MGQYLSYWKRGWWAALLMTCTNIALAILVLPVALTLTDSPSAYWLGSIAVWLVAGVPFSGWLFERFASGSTRLIKDEFRDENA